MTAVRLPKLSHTRLERLPNSSTTAESWLLLLYLYWYWETGDWMLGRENGRCAGADGLVRDRGQVSAGVLGAAQVAQGVRRAAAGISVNIRCAIADRVEDSQRR